MILLNKLFSTKKSAKGRVDYPLLLLGAVIYGVSVGLVLSPNEIAPRRCFGACCHVVKISASWCRLAYNGDKSSFVGG